MTLTGTAGSGKSAIIARAVTLSDPDVLAHPAYADAVRAAPAGTVPVPGSVDVAVLARDRDRTDLLHQILERLRMTDGVGWTDTADTSFGTLDVAQALRDQIARAARAHQARTGRPVMIVIDGVDEAIDRPGF